MDMMSWVGEEMGVVNGMHAGQSHGVSHVGRCRSTSRLRDEDTDDNRSHRRPSAQLWVGSSWNWSVFRRRP